jgi:hypothetical protein
LNNRWEKVSNIETNLLIRRFAYQRRNNTSKTTTSTKQRLKIDNTFTKQNRCEL